MSEWDGSKKGSFLAARESHRNLKAVKMTVRVHFESLGVLPVDFFFKGDEGWLARDEGATWLTVGERGGE